MAVNQPRLVKLSPKYLVGLRLRTTMADNQTQVLWRSFMPRRKEIAHRIDDRFYSVQVFAPATMFQNFTPHTPFDKWAAMEVNDTEKVPEGMEALRLPDGLYAVFIHRGLPGALPQTLQIIFGDWLPRSGYQVDNRPHFDVMGADYRPDDPDAEEEIWIPVKEKR